MKAGSKVCNSRYRQGKTSSNSASERRLSRNPAKGSDRKEGARDGGRRSSHNEHLAKAQRLTMQFETYLGGRGETRAQFAERAGVSVETLRRAFPREAAPIRSAPNERLLRKIIDAAGGAIDWNDFASRWVAPPELTRKFEAYLDSRSETRAMFANRIGVSLSWLSRVFPLNPMRKAKRLSIDSALRFCIGVDGYLTLADFRTAGICPDVPEDIARLCGETDSAPLTSVGRPLDDDENRSQHAA